MISLLTLAWALNLLSDGTKALRPQAFLVPAQLTGQTGRQVQLTIQLAGKPEVHQGWL